MHKIQLKNVDKTKNRTLNRLKNYLCFAFLLSSFCAFAAPQALLQGRWVGSLTTNGSLLNVGIIVDVFLSQPNNTREFPRLESIVRLSLGGPLGIERTTAHYTSVQYNYETGDLTLDEEGAPFILQALVKSKTNVEGKFTDKLTGKTGNFKLVFGDALPSSGEPCEPDEPCDPPDNPKTRLPTSGFLPTLAGIYSGTCNENESSRLEILGLRNNNSTSAQEFPASTNWNVRLGLQNRGQCDTNSKSYCVAKFWNNVDFSFMSSSLTLQSNESADQCIYGPEGQLECKIRMGTTESICKFSPEKSIPALLEPQQKSFQLKPSTADLVSLPAIGQDNSLLTNALNGTFVGYIFVESQQKYQPVQFASVSTMSTDNPHNEPNVFVSGSLQLLNSGLTPDLRFPIERRTFFPSPGFTLRSEKSDLFLVISKWTSGYLAGTAYSQSSGRLGAFELLKNATIQSVSLPNLAKNLSGAYESKGNNRSWHLELLSTPFLNDLTSAHKISGSAQILIPGSPFPRFAIQTGLAETFEGQIGITVKESSGSERSFIGTIMPNGDLNLRIGSSGNFGSQMPTADRILFTKLSEFNAE